MERLTDEIVNFFQNQGFVIVSTIDANGYPNNACKGIVEIDQDGCVYLLDLYHAKTRRNLEADPHISITAIDEHRFIGYSLKGKARIVKREEIKPHLVKAWEERITSRLTSRLIKNMLGEKGHATHPEAILPEPKYMIAIDVEEVVDLTPGRTAI
ncbi:MAG: pyridoxamine 5'-phosphate oxidase family protein [Candidatus Omnitrophica bacterium]|nr:pyridoxamine 5'-phosphate oxidase family protein [Candidatus Omnitrophota bacterium]